MANQKKHASAALHRLGRKCRTSIEVRNIFVLIPLVIWVMNFVIDGHGFFWNNEENLLWTEYLIRGTTVPSSSCWTHTILSLVIGLQNKSYPDRDWSSLLILLSVTKPRQFTIWVISHWKKNGIQWRLMNYSSIPSNFSWRGVSFRLQIVDHCWRNYGSNHRSYPNQTVFALHYSHHGRCVRRETIVHPLWWYGRSTGGSGRKHGCMN